MIRAGNLFEPIPPPTGDEDVATLVSADGIRIERIVSTGQASPAGFWYDQPQAEWVVVVAGAATVRFAEDTAPRRMIAGDYLLIPAGCRHRVDWTDPAEPTIWLAVHYNDENGAPSVNPVTDGSPG